MFLPLVIDWIWMKYPRLPAGNQLREIGHISQSCCRYRGTIKAEKLSKPRTDPFPPHEVSKIARETGAEDKSRTFKPWSHGVSLVYAQLTHSIGLNDLCDSLQLHSGPLSSVRGATAPSRNGLSNANRERPAEMAEQLFWRVM
jgi:hypothetical protein